MQNVLYIENAEDLVNFESTRFNVTADNGSVNLFKNIVTGGSGLGTEFVEYFESTKITILQHIYEKIEQTLKLKITRDQKLENRNLIEVRIDVEKRILKGVYENLLENWYDF